MFSRSGGSLSALLLDIFRAGNVEGMVVEVAAGGEPVLFLNDGQLVTDLSVEDKCQLLSQDSSILRSPCSWVKLVMVLMGEWRMVSSVKRRTLDLSQSPRLNHWYI